MGTASSVTTTASSLHPSCSPAFQPHGRLTVGSQDDPHTDPDDHRLAARGGFECSSRCQLLRRQPGRRAPCQSRGPVGSASHHGQEPAVATTSRPRAVTRTNAPVDLVESGPHAGLKNATPAQTKATSETVVNSTWMAAGFSIAATSTQRVPTIPVATAILVCMFLDPQPTYGPAASWPTVDPALRRAGSPSSPIRIRATGQPPDQVFASIASTSAATASTLPSRTSSPLTAVSIS